MKWFRHHGNLAAKPYSAAVLERGGLEAYGAFVRILEILCDNLDPQPAPAHIEKFEEVGHSLKTWARLLGIQPRKFERLLGVLEESGAITCRPGIDTYYIGAPQLLEWTDEYTRKRKSMSGHTPDNLRQEQSRSDQTRSNSDQSRRDVVAPAEFQEFTESLKSRARRAPEPQQGPRPLADFLQPQWDTLPDAAVAKMAQVPVEKVAEARRARNAS